MNAWKKVLFLVRNRQAKVFRTLLSTLMAFDAGIAGVVETDAIRAAFLGLG